MQTHGYSFPDEDPDKRHTVLSIGSPGLDVLDDLLRRATRQIDHIACLSDRDRLLESSVPVTLCSDGLTIFNTARELLPLIKHQPTYLIIGPDARDLRISLALTELKPERRGVWVAFIVAPDSPTDEWIALLHELDRRLTSVFLFEPADGPALPARQAVARAIWPLLDYVTDGCYSFDYSLLWRKSGSLTVTQIEAAGPDCVDQLIAQVLQLTDETLRTRLATHRAAVEVYCSSDDELSIYDYTRLADVLVKPYANNWLHMQAPIDRLLPVGTMRIVLIIWETELPSGK